MFEAVLETRLLINNVLEEKRGLSLALIPFKIVPIPPCYSLLDV